MLIGVLLMTVLFDELWNYSDPAGTEATFRALLADPPAEADDSWRAQLVTQIARTQGLQREFDDARATLAELEPRLGSDDVARVRWLLERGRVENSSGDRDGAKPFFLDAWELAAPESLDFYAVDAAHMLGIVEAGDDAMEWNRRALARAVASTDPMARRWRGTLANNIGWTLYDQGDYEGALAHFEEALVFRREQGKEDPIRIAEWCVAKAKRVLGRVEEALATQRELQVRAEASGAPDGFISEEIAECLLALGRTEEAAPHFARAYELLSEDPWLADAEPERLQRLKHLGEGAPPAAPR
ncbi:MAG: tetratricopeptide repeat protein [Gemmatimonadetes bacterium]|nr:tetratricopeptide repeat protein [Gemmatimonadota bacterium]